MIAVPVGVEVIRVVADDALLSITTLVVTFEDGKSQFSFLRRLVRSGHSGWSLL